MELTIESNEQTKNEKNSNQDKNLESEVKFSWSRVFKRGIQNMKDDVDPVYKGAKMGAYFFHGIPTWVREHKDGKLISDKLGFSIWSGVFVGAATAAAYFQGTKELTERVGTEGYALLGVPLACQLASYTREAFRRAKKTEYSQVILTKVSRAMNSEPNESYDLSIKDMVDSYSATLKKEKERQDEEIKNPKSERNRVIYSTLKRDEYGHFEDFEQRTVEEENDFDEIAKEKVLETASRVFDGLYADDIVGKTYEMDTDLVCGPLMRFYKHEDGHIRSKVKKRLEYKPGSLIQDMIEDTVKENNGVANIELLGEVKAVYNQAEDGSMHYEIKPNKLWKK